MRVGYFVGHFPYLDQLHKDHYLQRYAHGGVEMAAYHLADGMAKKGHEVQVFTTAMGSKDEYESKGNLQVHRYGTFFQVASANLSMKLLGNPLNYPLEIVHSHSPIPYSDLPALRYSRRHNVPLVVSYHFDGQETGGSFLRNSGVLFHNRYLLKKVLKQASAIIVGTNIYAQKSPHLQPFQDKVKIIPYGIDPGQFSVSYSSLEARERLKLPLEGDLILFFGSLVPYKGPEILLQAFNILKKKFKSLVLVYAGRGPLENTLEILSREMKLENQVIFAGFIPEELKPIYYCAADIYCLPSITRAESFGITNLEAMASGRPIVASRLGGIPDIVKDGENGFLVEPGNPQDLAQTLETLLVDKDLRNKMGKKGKKLVKNYTWEKVVDETLQLYQNLVQIR